MVEFQIIKKLNNCIVIIKYNSYGK